MCIRGRAWNLKRADWRSLCCSARESRNKFREKIGTRFEGVDFDVFIGCVGLIDRAWADADAGDAAVRKVRGVGKPWCAGELGAAICLEQALNHRVIRIRLHGRIFVGIR